MSDLTVHLKVKKYNSEGDIAWEYNPLRNVKNEDDSITDFTVDNEQLGINLENPIDIECQSSYDGTTNLILNDDINPPRIINTRITKLENNRYKVINRNQIKQSNLYKIDEIDKTTRLFRNIDKIPKVKFSKIDTFGQLKGGNYIFYFKYADSDFNQTDFIAETSIISVFNGDYYNPKSCNGTLINERTDKAISLILTNLDTSFTYFNVYFMRTSCDQNGVIIKEYGKIDINYEIKNPFYNLNINGYEDVVEIGVEEFNIQYNYVDRVKTQAQVQNRLFFANVDKPNENEELLRNLSLHIVCSQYQDKDKDIGFINPDSYWNKDFTTNKDCTQNEYYSPWNIYYKLGYMPGELYRLGIVYVYVDDHKSAVYNFRGIDFNHINGITKKVEDYNFKYTGIENIETQDILDNASLSNTGGVFRFRTDTEVIDYQNKKVVPIGLKIQIPKDVIEELKKLKIKGYYIVRQQRIPIFLCQGFSIGVDANSAVPMLRNGKDEKGNDKYIGESFLNDSSILTTEYDSHIIYSTTKGSSGLLCLDAKVDKQLQSLFNTSNFRLRVNQLFEETLETSNNSRRRYLPKALSKSAAETELTKIQYTPNVNLLYINEEIPQKIYNDKIYSTKAGVQEELKQVISFGKKDNGNSSYGVLDKSKGLRPRNYIRGIYTDFIGVSDDLRDNTLYDVYIRGFNEAFLQEYFLIRIKDKSPFFTCSDWFNLINDDDVEDTKLDDKAKGDDKTINCPDRINYLNEYSYYNALIEYIQEGIKNEEEKEVKFFNPEWLKLNISELIDKVQEDSFPKNFVIKINDAAYLLPIIYRGDCFTNTVTIRINRNFTSTSVPINDEIVEPNCWKENFKGVRETVDWANISKADVDAVPLGIWFTYKCISNNNLGLRSVDRFNTEEIALMGNPRNFYPLYGMSVKSSAKIPESALLNKGYNSTLGCIRNYAYERLPYSKDVFDTRVMFSNVQVSGAFKNSYKIFQGLSYQDYDRQYGGIVKILPHESEILAVFEHAVAIIPVNQKAMMQTTDGQEIHMFGTGVLQEQLSIISDTYGSIWKDSIIRTPRGLYGVDTYAKKIWRYSNNGFELISDFKIQRFLHDNIDLKELDKYTIFGVRNVKTHYNAFKNDVMFTFYNKDKIWNICYNELQDLWITRYSWTPLLSENIDNSYFSFDLLKTKIFGILNTNLRKKDDYELYCNPLWDGIWNKINNTNTLEEKTLMLSIIDKYQGYNTTEIEIKGYYLKDGEMTEDILYFGKTDKTFKYIEEKSCDFITANIYNVIDDSRNELDPNHESNDYSENSEQQAKLYNSYKKLNGALSSLTFKSKELDKYVYYTINYSYIPYVIASYNGKYDEALYYDENYDKNEYLVFGSVIKKYLVGLIIPYSAVSGTKYENDWNNTLLSCIYIHGRANIIDEINYLDRNIYNQALPTKWYDKQEPFEFEFIVKDPIGMHKIFDNLVIISNNVEPKSLEIEIVGDVYNFNKEEIFKYNYYKDEEHRRNKTETIGKYDAEFTPIEIENNKEIKKYQTKVNWDPITNTYSLVVHQDCLNIEEYGRRLGNIYYNEDLWYVELEPIYYNNVKWKDGQDPDKRDDDNNLNVPEYSTLKSTRIRDKYAKIRIKYKGDKLVIITALQTIMTQSYA